MFDSVIKLFKAVFNNEGIGQPLLEEEKPEVDLKSMTKKQLEEYGYIVYGVSPLFQF